MNRVAKLNAAQLTAKDSESWHNDYKDSAYIYAGGLSYELTEGDVVCIFSQYGEILDVNLVRDKQTGASKGFAFLRYEDQRSTILAVDNLSGSKVLGRTLRVDHVTEYKQPRKDDESKEDWDQDPRASMNVAPVALLTPEQRAAVEEREDLSSTGQLVRNEEDYSAGIDPEDPMYEFLVNERRERAKQTSSRKRSRSREKRSRRRHHSRDRSEGRDRERHRKRSRDREHRSRHDDDDTKARRKRSRSR